MENNYQLSRIHNYVNGLMSKEEMYSLEREALDDPFLQDAIDGYRLQKGVDVKQLSLLQQRLAERVEAKSDNRHKRFYSWQRLAVGAAAAVMFVTVCTLLLIRYFPQQSTSNLREVVVSEKMYDFNVTPFNSESDAVPVGGWEALYKVLYSGYSNNQDYSGILDVRFDIDSSKRATNISISGKDFDQDEELIDILRNKVKWEGRKAYFTLNINALEL